MSIKREEMIDSNLRKAEAWKHDGQKIVTTSYTSGQVITESLSLAEVRLIDYRLTICTFDLYLLTYVPLTARCLYLYYVDANNFRPLAIGVQLSVSHFIPEL